MADTIKLSDFTAIAGSSIPQLQVIGYLADLQNTPAQVPMESLLSYLSSALPAQGGGSAYIESIYSGSGDTVIPVSAEDFRMYVFNGGYPDGGNLNKRIAIDLSSTQLNGQTTFYLVYGSHTPNVGGAIADSMITFDVSGVPDGTLLFKDGDITITDTTWTLYSVSRVGATFLVSRDTFSTL